MRTVPLHGKKAAGRVALVDDEDYDLVMQYHWYVLERIRPSGTLSGPYAAARFQRGREVHNLVMHTLITGWPRTDHINHNGLDNQRSNLRPATNAQNQHNRRKTTKKTSSVYKGVTRTRGKWGARICFKGKNYSLGNFTSEIAAAIAYDAKAAELFGEYACLNFPDGPPPGAAMPPEQFKYQRVAEDLRERIRCGEWDQQMPMQRVLAMEYGVSRLTIQKVMAILRDEGLITMRRGSRWGSGSEVAPPVTDGRHSL